MSSLLGYIIFIGAFYFSVKKGFYDGILYGLIHKKIGSSGGSEKQQPFLYKKQAINNGWALVLTVGIPFLILTYFIYIPPAAFNDAKIYFKDQYYVIYFVSYGLLGLFIVSGIRWMYLGIKHGIIERKTKTYYHLSYGREYYPFGVKQGHKKVHRHIYFRGERAYKTGIARTILGAAYILMALLLFIDRDYYVGHAKKSIYPNVFESLKRHSAPNMEKPTK
jgi:hypothetical protein